ncbi:alpha-2-macroglobulin family protein [Methylobrevis pamukkalensis]|uniref:Alpha-2-macroglobulin family protein n=1 Tax=Methylobrevis pamukkalensis TaxID=1439726 RepID=A0A1E3H2N0_9HYPH|nr:alpha-2-macroglobulin family protein [Methylobrevis pamukkalensis]ODN69801.1 Alpha-2-macroglobulin family protein [Methylobrevis pamukkalensis]
MRDLYGQLIDRMIGVPGVVRSGGDGSGLNRLDGTPPTEKLVSFYQGPVKVDADGKVRAEVEIPDFNGTVRVMAMAWSKAGIGHAEQDVVIRDPVVVTASLPAFLAPGDASRLLLDVTHLDGPSGEMSMRVSAEGGAVSVDAAAASRSFTLTDKAKTQLLVPISGVAVGDAAIRVVLTTPDGKDLVKELALGVRANDPPVMRESTVALDARSGRITLASDLFSDFQPGSAAGTVMVGGVGGIDLPGLVRALDRYPYGCAEQITSRALPLVYLDDVILAAGLAGETPVKERVQQAITEVLENQSSTGAFGLWAPGSGDLWLDAYVTDFLTRAREKGYAVPATAFDLAVTNLSNQMSYAADFTSGGEDVAYALYVLARNGRASIGDLRYYAEVKLDAFASPLAKAQVGAALALYGDKPRAAAAFRNAVGSLGTTDAGGWRSDYGSRLRDGAAILTLVSETGTDGPDADALARDVVAASSAQRYLSTQEKAWMLLAANGLLSGAGRPDLGVDGAPFEGVFTRALTPEALAAAPLTIENRGERRVEAKVTVRGAPVTPEPAGGTGYSLHRSYYDLDGFEVDPAAIQLGERLVTVLTVTVNRAEQARLVVDDPLPAGLAIDNPNLLASADVAKIAGLDLTNSAARTEFRSDRFIAALDLSGSATTEIRLGYMVRAIAPGVFAHPAALVEDMYRPEQRGWTDTGRIEIIGPVR